MFARKWQIKVTPSNERPKWRCFHGKKLLFWVIIVMVLLILVGSGIWRMMMTQPLTTQAWIYPGDQTCSAQAEYEDGRNIDVLKPEYYNLSDSGVLTPLTTGCNAYTPENVAAVKKASKKQFVTISGGTLGLAALTRDSVLASNFISTLHSFLDTTHFTGVELDIEGFSAWTPAAYDGYKTLITQLGMALHADGYQLMIDGPAISDPAYQAYYPHWRWEDFNTLPVDALVVMAYDYQYDQGAGAPVAPLIWIQNICQWMQSKITDHSKIIIGINSYGYHALKNSYAITKDTYTQSSQLPGFAQAKRDPASGELMSTVDNIVYDYSDTITLQGKVSTIQNAGINSVSVFHLGGNPWFHQNPQPLPSPSPALSLSITLQQMQQIYGILEASQVAMIKNMLT